jgi:hypothetical protein
MNGTRRSEKITGVQFKAISKERGQRISLFLEEEKPLLAPLPATPFELAEWKQATVSSIITYLLTECLLCPSEYIKRKVDVRVTEKTIEIFFNHNLIAPMVDFIGDLGSQYYYGTYAGKSPKIS